MFTYIVERARSYSKAVPCFVPRTFEELHTHYPLFDDGSIAVVYAPVDYVNTKARLTILGITPGLQQARIAFETWYEMGGRPDEERIGREINRRAAFAGSMRTNLVTMLDDLDVHTFLGVRSVAALFSERADLLHSTSALRYPVFKNGRDYSGHSPEPTRHEALLWMLENMLAPELNAVPDALIVPLGRTVDYALKHLTERGLVAGARWLPGFPHPSGANGHRRTTFERNRDDLRERVRRFFQASRPPNRCS